jgi:hypothetical protein
MGASARKRFAPEPANPFDDQLKQRRRGRLSAVDEVSSILRRASAGADAAPQARERAGRATLCANAAINHQKEI